MKKFALLTLLFATPAIAQPAAFKDKDEGSMGPLQDAHEAEVVFSHTLIQREARDAKLVTTTTLDEPLYVRAYFAKTPARLMHERGARCFNHKFLVWKLLDAQGKELSELSRMRLQALFPEIRTASVTRLDGKTVASIVPTSIMQIGAQPEDLGTVHALGTLAPGRHELAVEARITCEGDTGSDGKDYAVAARGTITFEVKAGDTAKFVRRVGPKLAHTNATAIKRVRPLYAKLLAKGAALLAFDADATVTWSDTRETKFRAILRNADKTCSFVTGALVEEHFTRDIYAKPKAQTRDPLPLPCPDAAAK